VQLCLKEAFCIGLYPPDQHQRMRISSLQSIAALINVLGASNLQQLLASAQLVDEVNSHSSRTFSLRADGINRPGANPDGRLPAQLKTQRHAVRTSAERRLLTRANA